MNDTLDQGLSGFAHKIREAWSLQPLLVPLGAIVLSFVVGGVLIALIGVNPFEAYWALLQGAFGSWERVAGSIARSVPFMGSALALAFAFRAGLFNIGAEGQLLVGGITAAWVGTLAFMYDTPSILAIPIIIIAGAADWTFIVPVIFNKKQRFPFLFFKATEKAVWHS